MLKLLRHYQTCLNCLDTTKVHNNHNKWKHSLQTAAQTGWRCLNASFYNIGVSQTRKSQGLRHRHSEIKNDWNEGDEQTRQKNRQNSKRFPRARTFFSPSQTDRNVFFSRHLWLYHFHRWFKFFSSRFAWGKLNKMKTSQFCRLLVEQEPPPFNNGSSLPKE